MNLQGSFRFQAPMARSMSFLLDAPDYTLEIGRSDRRVYEKEDCCVHPRTARALERRGLATIDYGTRTWKRGEPRFWRKHSTVTLTARGLELAHAWRGLYAVFKGHAHRDLLVSDAQPYLQDGYAVFAL